MDGWMDLVFFSFCSFSLSLPFFNSSLSLSLPFIEKATSCLIPPTSSLDNKSTNATKIITNNIHTPQKERVLGGD